jgi:hypothetical protein
MKLTVGIQPVTLVSAWQFIPRKVVRMKTVTADCGRKTGRCATIEASQNEPWSTRIHPTKGHSGIALADVR